MALPTLGESPGFLKAGFQGLQGSGKTWTATALAIGVRKHFGLTGPIAFYDTETGSAYVAPLVKEHTGQPLAGIRSRSLDNLINFVKDCEKEGASVLIVDSMTHIWKEVCDSYLQEVNDSRKNKGLASRGKLEFQDWNTIKLRFNKWTTAFLNSRLHIIICGRLGWTYDFQTDEESGKKELIKTGTKMKTEGEFGYEPSLLVEMERGKDGQDNPLQIATILKDRFNVMMSKEIAFKTGKETPESVLAAFMPHVARLIPGSHVPVDTDSKTVFGVDEGGADPWRKELKSREIYAEEIIGLLNRHFPGTTNEAKATKNKLIFETFKTDSWVKISEKTESTILSAGLNALREKLEPAPEAPAPDDSLDMAKEP